MSRLQKHKQKEQTKRILTLILVSVALMAIFFFIGLQSIINATVFLNNLIRGNSTQNEETEDASSSFYGILNVNEPEPATSEATIIVSGDATEFKKVEFYLNNVKVEDTTIRNGVFSEEIGKLRAGENKMHVVATTDNGKNKKKSEVYSVTYINEPPELEIESPKDGDKTTNTEIQVKGKTDKDTSVRVNNSPVVVDFEGNFSTNVRLKEGENTIEVTSTDIAGNTEKEEIKVTREKDE